MSQSGSDAVTAVLVVALLVAVFGLIVWVIRRGRRAGGTDSASGAGFTGWLLLLALGQTVLPFRLAGAAFTSLAELQEVQSLQNGPLAVGIDISVTAAFAVFSAFVAVLMWRRSPSFPRLFVIEWALLLGYAALGPLLYTGLTEVPASVLYGDPDKIRSIAGNSFAAIWVAYVLRSEQVARTFGHRPLKQPLAAGQAGAAREAG